MSATAAVIAGAAGGIGRAVVEKFARDEQYDVVACLDLAESVHDVADEYGGDAYQVDVSDPAQVAAAIAEIERDADVHAAVSLAAVFGKKHQSVDDISDSDWNDLVGVNLKGQFNLVREVGPGMKERGDGYIVNVSSMAGKKGSAVGGVHYSASKSGIFGLTKGLAKQLSPEVRVNCVTPGLINTPPVTDYWTDEEIEEYTNRLPLERMGEPEDVAHVVHFLCGEGAAYMTGCIVDVDGGSRLL